MGYAWELSTVLVVFEVRNTYVEKNLKRKQQQKDFKRKLHFC